MRRVASSLQFLMKESQDTIELRSEERPDHCSIEIFSDYPKIKGPESRGDIKTTGRTKKLPDKHTFLLSQGLHEESRTIVILD